MKPRKEFIRVTTALALTAALAGCGTAIVSHQPTPKNTAHPLGNNAAADTTSGMASNRSAGSSTNQSLTRTTTGTSSVISEMTTLTQPLEGLSSHWRVIVMHTLLNQGPYFNVLLYYRGSTTMSIGRVTVHYDGSTSTSELNGQPIHPGAKVASLVDMSFPHGISNSLPIQVSWMEQGKKYSETLRRYDKRTSIEVTNQRVYSGGDAHWKVSYEYETIKGAGFSHSYAVFAVARIGQPIGNVDCIVSSASGGTADFSIQSSASNTSRLNINVNQFQPGYDINGNRANLTIYGKAETDVVVLNKVYQKPS